MILLCLALGILAAFAATGLSLFLGAGLFGAVAAYVIGGTAGFALAAAFGPRKRRQRPQFAMTSRSA